LAPLGGRIAGRRKRRSEAEEKSSGMAMVRELKVMEIVARLRGPFRSSPGTFGSADDVVSCVTAAEAPAGTVVNPLQAPRQA
jgi:hypothetical protein